MASDQVPDLQAILATLAQFSGSNYIAPQDTTQLLPGLGFAHAGIEQQNHAAVFDTDPGLRPLDPRPRPQGRSVSSPKPIDPATITTWQDGLRCVTKIAAQNAQFAASIRKMMEDQRKHEMRWYSERQALKQMQASRSSSAAQAQSILQSLSNSQDLRPSSEAAESQKKVELSDFDRKVHDAQQAMESAFTGELKGLGVPFFGTEAHLVIADDYDSTREQPPDSHPKWSALVTEKDLLVLRRRMVGHLEDLYRD